MASDWLRRDRGTIVLLDSNAIMMLFEFSINLEGELTRLFGKFKIVIPKPVIDELKFLSEKGDGRKKFIAKPALKLIERYNIIDVEGKGDRAILDLAKKLDCVVLTNDKLLKAELKKLSIHVVYLKGKNKLVLE